MCGIVGYFQIRGASSPCLPCLVRAARDRLIHRGPDDAGLYVNQDRLCVLGSRRLSIIDLSDAASQPMSNEDATVWLDEQRRFWESTLTSLDAYLERER